MEEPLPPRKKRTWQEKLLWTGLTISILTLLFLAIYGGTYQVFVPSVAGPETIQPCRFEVDPFSSS